MISTFPDCPLCYSGQIILLAEINKKYYYECERCRLEFLQPDQRLGASDEKAHYATHENDPADMAYREFLDQLARPLAARLTEGACGLDYGSGPGPTLSVMLRERGYVMRNYDPFFADEVSALTGEYDFITCTETVEHFYHPGREFQRFDKLLRPGSWLGIMTGMRDPGTDFADWYYVRDPSHVSFYRLQTMEWIARYFNWFLLSPGPNLVLFQVNPPLTGPGSG